MNSAAGVPTTLKRTSRRRLAVPWAAITWVGLLVVLSGYTYLRSLGDELVPPLTVGWIERAIFGAVPSDFLQAHIYERDVLWLDFLGYVVHVSWFMVPYFAAFGLMIFARHRLLEYFAWIVATHYIGAIFYILLPVEPPWMEVGTLRILDERVFIPFTRADNNPVAAFPSLHCALPMSIALFFLLRMHSPRWAAAFAGWGLGIGFFVVYLGEHWVIDVLGGYALAGLVAWLMTSNRVRALADRIPGQPVARAIRFNNHAFPRRIHFPSEPVPMPAAPRKAA